MSGRVLAGVKGVSIRYGSRSVLKGVDLDVHEREIVTLIGPNGAGKSTLVRIMLGLEKPQRGEAFRRAGVRVGYVPQRMSIDPVLPMTVQRFLALSARHSPAELLEALAEVGAEGLLKSSLATLSGGELQRVLLTRALVRRPQLMVLDEPAQGVDVSGQGELYNLIARLRDERGCGVLMVSHDLHLVMARTDRVFCLDQQVCCTGRPEQVRMVPGSTALLPSQIGLAPYTHRHGEDSEAHGWCGSCAKRGGCNG